MDPPAPLPPPLSPTPQLRHRLWDDLCFEKLNIVGHFLSIGDFNATVFDEESSSHLSSRIYSAFSDWIFREGLIDLGFIGSNST